MDFEAPPSPPADSEMPRHGESNAEEEEVPRRNRTVDAYSKGSVMHCPESEPISRRDTELIDDSQFGINMQLVEQNPNIQFNIDEQSDAQLQFNFSGFDETHMLLGEDGCKEVARGLEFYGNCENMSGAAVCHEDNHSCFANVSQSRIDFINNSSILKNKRTLDTSEELEEKQLVTNHLIQKDVDLSLHSNEQAHLGLSNNGEVDVSIQDDAGPSLQDSDFSKKLQLEVVKQPAQMESELKLEDCDVQLLVDMEHPLKTTETLSEPTMTSDVTSVPSETLLQKRDDHLFESTHNLQNSSVDAQRPSHQGNELQQLLHDVDGDIKEQAIATDEQNDEINVLKKDLSINNSEPLVEGTEFTFTRLAGMATPGNPKGYLEVSCLVVPDAQHFPELQVVEKDYTEIPSECGDTCGTEAPSCIGRILERSAYCPSTKLTSSEEKCSSMDLSQISDNQANCQDHKAIDFTVSENQIDYIEAGTVYTNDILHDSDVGTNLGGSSYEVVEDLASSMLPYKDISDAESLHENNENHHKATNPHLEGYFNNTSVAAPSNSGDALDRSCDEATVAKSLNETVSDGDNKVNTSSNSLLIVDVSPELCISTSGNKSNCKTMGNLHDCVDTTLSIEKGQMNQTFQVDEGSPTTKHENTAEEIGQSLVQSCADIGKASNLDSGDCEFLLAEERGSRSFQEPKEEQKEAVHLNGDLVNSELTVLQTEKQIISTTTEDITNDKDHIGFLPTGPVIASIRAVLEEDDSNGDGEENNSDNGDTLDSEIKELGINESKSSVIDECIYPHTDVGEASRLSGQNEPSIHHSNNLAEIPHIVKDDASSSLNCKEHNGLDRVDLTASEQDVNALPDSLRTILTDGNMLQTSDKNNRDTGSKERTGIGRTTEPDGLTIGFQDHKITEVVSVPAVLTVSSKNQQLSRVNQTVDFCILEEKKNNLTNAELVDRKCEEKESKDISSEIKHSILENHIDEKGQKAVLIQLVDTGPQSLSGLEYKPLMIRSTSEEEPRSSEEIPKNFVSAETLNPHSNIMISLDGKEEGVITQAHKNLVDADLRRRVVDIFDSCSTDPSYLVEKEELRKADFPASRCCDLQAINGVSEAASGSSPNLGSNLASLDAKVDNSLLNGAKKFNHCLPQAGILPVEYFETIAKQLNLSKDIGTTASPVFDASSLTSDLQNFRSNLPEQSICPTVDSSRVIHGASSRSQLAYPLEQVAIPDLNVAEATSTAHPTQPFTDVQQVQLRAQILVYGSLIQGAVPDEALMVPAFKDINGGRQDIGKDAVASSTQFWEKAWRAALDRIKGRAMLNAPKEAAQPATMGVLPGRMPEEGQQRSCFSLNPSPDNIICDVDARSHPVSTARCSDANGPKSNLSRIRQNSAATITARNGIGTVSVPFQNHSHHQINHLPTRVLPFPYVEAMQNPSGSRPTQLDSVKLPFRPALSSPHVMPFIPGTTHWVSAAPSAGTEWSNPVQAAGLDVNASFSCVQSFAGRDGPQDLVNNQRIISTSRIPFVPVAAAIPTTGEINNLSSLPKGNPGAGGLITVDFRPRKRKKSQLDSSVHHDMDTSASSLSLPNASVTALPESHCIVVATCHVPAPVVQVPFTSNKTIGWLPMPHSGTSTLSSLENQYQLASGRETSEISANSIEQAKLIAEEATSFADGAVKHCESLWNQLQSQNISGIVSGKEAKLAFSAVAISAAASVAKAAAAAGRVAYEAALQAKLMGEDALGLPDGENYDQSRRGVENELMLIQGSSGTCQSGNEATFETHVTPNNFVSVIRNATEAARKRLEDASAAKMRAHNIESIVKAAELAAKAVSHAGVVVAIGEHIPFTLDTILDGGPHDIHHLINTKAPDHALQKEKENIEEVSQRSSGRREKQSKGNGSKETKDSLGDRKFEKSSEQPCQLVVGRSECETPGLSKASGNDKEEEMNKLCNAEMMTRCTDMVAIVTTQASGEIDFPNEGTLPSRAQVDSHVNSASYQGSCQIGEGSIVEVLSDEEGLRGVWFSARVKSVGNGKALVIYDELLSDDNSLLEEWIDLRTPPGEAPKIRLGHPMARINYEGTRKRRRAAMGNYNWSAGDRVDAWIKDGWWEGEVLDKTEDDETKIKVHFPGEGDTTFIKPWNLRPSLIWKDGHWILWTDIKIESLINQVEDSIINDELPAAKRHKVDTSAAREIHIGQQQVVDEGLKITGKRVTEKLRDVKSGESQGVQKSNIALPASGGDFESFKSRRLGRENVIGKELRMNQPIEGSKVVFGVPKFSKSRRFIQVSRMTESSLKGKVSSKGDGIGTYEVPVSRNQNNSNNGSEDPVGSMKKQSQETINKAKESNQSKRVPGTRGKKPSGGDVTSSNPVSVHGAKFGKMTMLPETQETNLQKSNSLSVTIIPKQPSMQKQTLPNKSIPLSKDVDSVNNKHPVFLKKKMEERAAPKPSMEVLEPRRSSRRIQPTSKLLEGLESTPKFG